METMVGVGVLDLGSRTRYGTMRIGSEEEEEEEEAWEEVERREAAVWVSTRQVQLWFAAVRT